MCGYVCHLLFAVQWMFQRQVCGHFVQIVYTQCAECSVVCSCILCSSATCWVQWVVCSSSSQSAGGWMCLWPPVATECPGIWIKVCRILALSHCRPPPPHALSLLPTPHLITRHHAHHHQLPILTLSLDNKNADPKVSNRSACVNPTSNKS